MTDRTHSTNIVPGLVIGESRADRPTLRTLSWVLSQLFGVEDVLIKPNPQEPQSIKAHLSDPFFKNSLTTPILRIDWRVNGDFSIRYAEGNQDKNWWCQWDRHVGIGYPGSHFHYPPDGETVKEISWASEHPIDILLTVLTAIEDLRMSP